MSETIEQARSLIRKRLDEIAVERRQLESAIKELSRSSRATPSRGGRKSARSRS